MSEQNQVATTALVNIQPQANEKVMSLYNEGGRLEEYANARVIRNTEDIKNATDDLGIIARLKKAIEAERVAYTGPINTHLKDINDAFKIFMAPILMADQITRDKILAFRREQERIRLEEERINAERKKLAEDEMKLKGELTEPVGLVEVSEKAPDHYRTNVATLGTSGVKKWEVEDLSKVPIEYLMVDAVRVGKVIRAGGTIPGIRTRTEEGLRVTTQAPPPEAAPPALPTPGAGDYQG